MQGEGLQLMQRLECGSLECMQRVPWPQLVALDSCCHLYCYAAVCLTLIAASAVAHAAACLTLVVVYAAAYASAAAFISGNTLLPILVCGACSTILLTCEYNSVSPVPHLVALVVGV